MRSSRHNQRWPRPRDGPSHRLAITVPCCAHFREGPVLAILAMLALKDALCVAPGGSAPLFPFRSAPWPPMFQAGTGKRRLNRTRKPARHDRSHALTTQKGTSWRCGNRGHFGVALTCLRYLAHRLSHGSVLVLDDWPHRIDIGEGRAFAEWIPSVPHLKFEFLFLGTWGHLYIRVWHRDRPVFFDEHADGPAVVDVVASDSIRKRARFALKRLRQGTRHSDGYQNCYEAIDPARRLVKSNDIAP